MARRTYDDSPATSSPGSDLESRVAALEKVVQHLQATQPHLMPQTDTPAEVEDNPHPELESGEVA